MVRDILCGMSCVVVMREKLIQVLRQLAQQQPVAEIRPEQLALAAQLSVDEVNRTLGVAENYPALLAHDPVCETRARILAAAMQVFAQKGWQRSSLDEIAHAAGMTKGAIYWHFRNKADLFFALLDARLRRDTTPLREEILHAERQAQQGATEQALIELFGKAWQRCASDRDWPRLFLEVVSQSADPEVAARLRGLYEHVWRISGQFACEMQDSQLVRRDIDPAHLGILCCALFDGLMFAALANPQLDLQEAAAQLIPILWSGLAPDKSGA